MLIEFEIPTPNEWYLDGTLLVVVFCSIFFFQVFKIFSIIK